MRFFKHIIFLSILFASFSSHAIGFSIFDNSNCNTFSYRYFGDHIVIKNWNIAEGNYECLFEKLKPFNAMTIVNGHGGHLFEAHRIADKVKELKIPVGVSGSCVSSCTFVAAAATELRVCKNTQIGIHHYGILGQTVVSPEVSAFHYEKMIDYGIAIKPYRKIFESTPHERMYDLSFEEMKEMKFNPKISKSCK